MPDTTHHPIVPVTPPEEHEPLERYRIAKWIPVVVPLLALLMVVLLAFIIGQAL